MKVIIFGLGELGRKLVTEIKRYIASVEIVCIVDNNVNDTYYEGIKVNSINALKDYEYDEVWVCTSYHKEIFKQLIDIGISKEIIFYMEPVVPVLEYRLREKMKENVKDIYPSDVLETEIEEIKDYLETHHLRMYCSALYDEYLYKESEIFWDDEKNLFYGIYKEKKIYLAKRFNTEEKARAYFNAVTMEQDKRSPHSYSNYEISNKKGRFVDIGAAEGIFGLEIIDMAEHLYMVEVEEQWIYALECTYEQYKDKVTIISALVGEGKGNTKTIDELFANKEITYIKMDIEGMELQALKGAEKVINSSKLQLAVCTYHNKEDNIEISHWLNKRKYKITHSHGLVLCQGDWELERDDVGFRRALLFAKNC